MSARPELPGPQDADPGRRVEPGQVLHDGLHSRLVRRRATGTGRSVLVKHALGDHAAQRLRAERAILERLAGIAGVPQLTSWADAPPGDALVFDDPGGVPLSDALRVLAFGLPALLDIALQLAHTLAEVHRRGVCHGNIRPSHIVSTALPGAPGPVVLFGFGQASLLAGPPPAGAAPTLGRALAYLAPEQTGRTGRSVDQRADLYGVGATLYELLTGRAPFADGDPLQLLHTVLAQRPVAPHELAPDMPPALSALVMRLLEKEPDRRYQSAEGLAHDLGLLRDRLGGGAAGVFTLGEHDFAARLAPPARPVGRAAEFAALREAFERAPRGARGVVIAGAPGVGKTMLINELRPLVSIQQGWFVTGKFDQYRHDQATDAVHQALRGLGRLLLAEPESVLAALRPQMRLALGSAAGVFAAALPEFALLLGLDPLAPAPAADDPLKVGPRLVRCTIDLLRCIASPQRPLVIVLDDLQWAAPLPLAFVDAMLTDTTLRGVLLIGAYRPTEVDATHPLVTLRARWERFDRAPLLLVLQNLPPADLAELIGAMLRLAPTRAAELAGVLGERTAGNPFDAVELINALRHDGALVRRDGDWHWDAAAIRRHIGSGNVVDLLAARIERLPSAAQQALATMACLGGEIGFDLLCAANGDSSEHLQASVAPALEDGLLVTDSGAGPALRFCDDRVQQAAWDRLDAPSRQTLQLVVGRRLATQDAFAAVAAAQYLAAIDAVHEAPERRLVARLFRIAAAQVRDADNARAERFVAAAIDQLAACNTPADTALAAPLEIEWHGLLYSLGRLDAADGVFRAIEGRGADALALVDPVCVQIGSLTNRGRPGEAVALGLSLLRRLGLEMPAADLAGAVQHRFTALQQWIQDAAQAAELRADVTDPRVTGAARIMNRLQAPAFFTDLTTVAWLVLESQRLWAEHGPCAALAANLSRASLVAISLRQDYRTGYDAIRLVLQASEARGYEPEGSQARHLFAITSAHWFEPLENGIRQARLAREGLLQGGDLQNAAFTYRTTIAGLLDSAPNLASYAREIEAGLAFAARTGNDHATAVNLADRQLLRSLRGETTAPGGFDDHEFNEAAHLAGLARHPMAVVSFHIRRALAAAVFSDTDSLVRHASAARPLLPYILGFYPNALAQLLQALALAERLKTADPAQRVPLLAEFDDCRDWLARRAADAPDNFLHLLRWTDAERAWATGDFQGAACAFDAALEQGATRQRPWHNALLAERAGGFMLAHGMGFAGRQMLAEAHRRYAAWGALAKLRQLEQRHVFLGIDDGSSRGARDTPRDAAPADAIDMLGVVRASQAISSETSLERLRLRVIELLAEMTGATTVRIALWHADSKQWLLPQPTPDGGVASSLTVAEAGARGLLPLAAFRYAERTREPLLVDDATRDDRFAHDLYFAGQPQCSLLLVPIDSQGAPRAILVLENRLSGGAFTTRRLDAVMLVAGQLAVSLDNALLYERLEQRVRERGDELQQAQAQLLGAARLAGMAEIATNVLHNVGNVLNSVNVSAELIGTRLRASKVGGLARAVRLMDEHTDDLGEFLTRDTKGRMLPTYLRELAPALQAEHAWITDELDALGRSVDHIKEVVATQQSYAGTPRVVEWLTLDELVADALRMHAGALTRHGIEVVTELAELPELPLDRHRLLQVLVNLISNAKQALDGVTDREPRITLAARLVDAAAGSRILRITVADNGEGIASEHLARVFAHGFTTRRNGHGFGLHSCVLAAQEMGGSLSAHSDGAAQGAIFTLDVPTAP